MRYNIVFSIPVHERYEVVLDQILNYLSFNPECAIVLHISPSFDDNNSLISKELFLSFIKNKGNVFINPSSVRTGWSDIIQAHISNFHYVDSIIEFEYFSMCASNELFVKEGLYSYINNFDCGVSFIDAKKHPEWVPAQYANKDLCLRKMIHDLGSDVIMPSHIEGSFYSRDIFFKICSVIDAHFDYKEAKLFKFYPREEVYFSTVLWALSQRDKSIKVKDTGLFTLIHWNDHILRYNCMEILLCDIRKCKKAESPYHSVKRIPRIIDDYRRAYIRQNRGYFDELKSLVNNLEKMSDFTIIRKDISLLLYLWYDYIKTIICNRSLYLKKFDGNQIQDF